MTGLLLPFWLLLCAFFLTFLTTKCWKEEVTKVKKVTNVGDIVESTQVQTPYALVGWLSAGWQVRESCVSQFPAAWLDLFTWWFRSRKSVPNLSKSVCFTFAPIPSAETIPKSRPDSKVEDDLSMEEAKTTYKGVQAEKGKKLAICSGSMVNPHGSSNTRLSAYEIPNLDQVCPHLILEDHSQDF